MESSKTNDLLGLAYEPKFTKNLLPGEKVVYSQELQKINDYNKAQKRNLAFTNKRVVNLSGKKVKRMIDMEKVKGFTYTDHAASFEFVFHVEGEGDYRFRAPMKS